MKRIVSALAFVACGKLANDPPVPPAIDCFGTSCSATCCLVGDAALCTEDANACVETIPLGDAGDANITVSNTFECFSASDCPPEPAGSAFDNGPIVCCFSNLEGPGTTGCAREGLGPPCGIGAARVCTSDTECGPQQSCHPVEGLPLSVCY